MPSLNQFVNSLGPFFARPDQPKAQVVLLTEDPLVLSHYEEQGLGVHQWLESLTREQGRTLLTRFQRRAIWQAILEEHRARFPVSDPVGVALDLESFHQALTEGRHTRFRSSKDSAVTFWWKKYRARLKEEQVDDLPGRLQQVASGTYPLLDMSGQRLRFASLTPTSPLWADLLARLEEAGASVDWCQPERSGTGPKSEPLRAANREEAFWVAAEWTQERLEKGEPVRIVTSASGELARWRQVLGQCGASFTHALEAARFPLLSSLLDLFSLDRPLVEFSDWSRLLRCPFVGDWSAEAFERSAIETRLRRAGHQQPPVSKLLHLCGRHGGHSLLPLLHGLKLKSLGERTHPEMWSQRFRELMELASWPGDRPLEPREEQAKELALSALEDLASLRRWMLNITHHQAWGFLAQALEERAWSLLDASAVETATPEYASWLDDRVSLRFPGEVAGPSRFEHLLPAASLKRVERQRQILSATEWSVRLKLAPGDELEELAGMGERDTLYLPPATRRELAQVEMEAWHDSAVPVAEGEAVRGGASLLSYQASCPFRGFGALRLRARPLESVGVGLDARQRGQLVHDVLETFWARIQSQDNLLKLEPEALEESIHSCVTEVVARAVYDYPEELDGRGYELERRRLVRALRTALELERERPPFRVLKTEEEVEFRLGGVPLRLRIDRIDEQDNGTLLLLDYKTGRPALADWYGERPDAPQLPLYLLAVGEAAEGLAFFRLRPGQECFMGISSSPFSRLRRFDSERWEGARQQWGQVMSDLMAEFLAGETRVEPKRYPGSCRHCGLSTLCRVGELKRQ